MRHALTLPKAKPLSNFTLLKSHRPILTSPSATKGLQKYVLSYDCTKDLLCRSKLRQAYKQKQQAATLPPTLHSVFFGTDFARIRYVYGWRRTVSTIYSPEQVVPNICKLRFPLGTAHHSWFYNKTICFKRPQRGGIWLRRQPAMTGQ